MSGVNLDGREIRKGAADAIEAYLQTKGGSFPEEAKSIVSGIAVQGGTPLVVVEGSQVLGVIRLSDVVKGGIRERFSELRRMGIRTVMITGDNPLTAAAVAAEAGVDDFLAQATPETKLNLIRTYQAQGHLVAMTGDGTNDAPALAQADVAVAMNTGTQAAKEAGNLVDLDSNPTKLIEIVEIGKQLLMTRGTLTTFSISNDVAKYFAILPAAFSGIYPGLAVLNVMDLSTPQSAILSAVIFNALIIVALIPLALRGVRYRPMGAAAVLRRNLIIYGAGGLVVPFAGIKAIDMIAVAVKLDMKGNDDVATDTNGPPALCRHDPPDGHRVPLGCHGVGAGAVPPAGQRQPRSISVRERPRRNLSASPSARRGISGDGLPQQRLWPITERLPRGQTWARRIQP